MEHVKKNCVTINMRAQLHCSYDGQHLMVQNSFQYILINPMVIIKILLVNSVKIRIQYFS